MTAWPWMEAPGRFSSFKLVVLLALFAPGMWTAGNFVLGLLGPRPLTEAIHQIGLWAIRFLFVSLAITPLRQILQWPGLLLVRRMVGVAAFAYGFIHLTLYAIDENLLLLHVASEIVLRIYLTIGFTALVGMALLAATSTDAMVRELGGRRWRRLHTLVYGIAALAVIHMFMQSKADVQEATWMTGMLGWLLAYRATAKGFGRGGRVPLGWVAGLSVGVAVVTALGEALYFWWKMNVAPLRLLAFDFSLIGGVRPPWIVLLAGVALTLAGAAARRRWTARAAA